MKEINNESSRNSIVRTAFSIKYSEHDKPWDPLMNREETLSFKEFDKNMGVYTKQEILKNLIENLDKHIDKLNSDKNKHGFIEGGSCN